MVTHLFPDLLANDDQYQGAKRFWSELVDGVCNDVGQHGEWQPWLHEFFADGSPIPREFTPIFDAANERLGRAIRVLQGEPESNTLEIAAWFGRIDRLDENDLGPIDELIINCALSKESAEIAKSLITAWVQDDASIPELEKLIADLTAG